MSSSGSHLSHAASVVARACLLAVAAGCSEETSSPIEEGVFDWGLPPDYPVPPVPADNPMSTIKVELGRHLFYDKRLSGNRTYSCASCHRQELAFTDGLATSVGSTGEPTARSSMSLTNVAYLAALTWANPRLRSLEEQALVPMFGDEPVELGLHGLEGELLERLRAEPRYQELFPGAFPEDRDPFTIANIARALATFQRTLLSHRSPYDAYLREGPSALPAAAFRGKRLFYSEKLKCFLCHGGVNLGDTLDYRPDAPVRFHNTGLYNIDGAGAYPPASTGLFATTRNPDDMGRFRAPTLRNIAVTAPYMHDGSIETLEGVLDHYAAGGRTLTSGPYPGDGSQNPYKSEFVEGFELSSEEQADVVAFLKSATDEEFLRDPRFADPWE
jgi:cytochrome c peroxidase